VHEEKPLPQRIPKRPKIISNVQLVPPTPDRENNRNIPRIITRTPIKNVAIGKVTRQDESESSSSNVTSWKRVGRRNKARPSDQSHSNQNSQALREDLQSNYSRQEESRYRVFTTNDRISNRTEQWYSIGSYQKIP